MPFRLPPAGKGVAQSLNAFPSPGGRDEIRLSGSFSSQRSRNLALGVPYIGLRPYGRAYSLVVIRDAADYCGTPLKRDLGSRPLRRGMSDERDTAGRST